MLQIQTLFIFLPVVLSYRRYAPPLQLATPNDKGVYEFDFVIRKKLSMAFSNTNKYQHTTPVDYDPNTEQWSQRDRDQLLPCNQNYTMDFSNATEVEYLEDVVVLDGLHKRMYAINEQSPGPTIVVPFMSELLLRVHNHVVLDGISLHVHGVDKQGLWYTDGVSFLQQCPIPSMSIHEYRFKADTKGTHWYHGHTQTDRGDGLFGGFIIMDGKTEILTDPAAGTKEQPSREYLALLQDWATETSEVQWYSMDEQLTKWLRGFDNTDECFITTRTTDGANVGGTVPISAIVINDKGWHIQEDIVKRPHKLPVERFQIKKSELLLFRIVNGGIAQGLMVHFEDHPFTIIAADGEDIVPFEVDKLTIFPGERYDVYLRGQPNPSKKNYIFQVETIQRYNKDWTIVDTTYGVGFLEYEDVEENGLYTPPSYLHPDCTPENKCTVLNCPFALYPEDWNFTCIAFDKLENPKPEEIDPEILQDTPFTSGYEEYFINMHFGDHVGSRKYENPRGMPYYNQGNMDLISKDCAKVNCSNDRFDRNCNCFVNYVHKLGNIVQLAIFNMGEGGGFTTGDEHPFHLHGHHFYVMKVGYPQYNGSAMISGMNQDINCKSQLDNCNDAQWTNTSWLHGAVPGMNTKNPTLRDTITLPVGGYILIRFRATNPGWWFAHCHLELHQMAGAAYAFRVGEYSQMPKPPSNFPHGCGYFAMDKIPTGSTSSFDHMYMLISILIFITYFN